MVLPVTAGVRLAMGIARHVGKKLVKKGTFAKGTRGYKLKGPVGGIGRGLKREIKRSYFRGKGQVRKTLTTGEPFKGIAKETKRHLKFYKKVISPQGTQFKNLITRPTFGDYGGVVATKGRKIRKNILKGGIYGGYIYGASKLRS